MSRSPGIIKRLSGHLPDLLHHSGSISDLDNVPAGGSGVSPTRSSSLRHLRKEERRLRRNSSSVSKKAAAAAHAGGSHVDDSMDDATFRQEWHMTKADEVKRMVEFLTVLQAEGLLRNEFEWSMYRRFLRARQHEIPRAMEMWSKHLAWRDSIGADSILEDFEFEERDAFISLYPQGYCNVDKMGRPVYIQQLGQLQFKKLSELTSEDRMIKFHVQEYERCVRYILPACSLAAGRNIEQTFAILDAKGVGIRHLTGAVKKMLQQIIQVDQNNYPEMLGKTAIINGGAAIGFVFPLIRPFLDKRTQNKIEICPKNFEPTLLQHIHADNLPEYLGGNSKATLLDDAGPWNDPCLREKIEADLHAEGPRLRWPPEAQGTAVPASIASSIAGGSPRAGSAPGSAPMTPHSTAHVAVSPFGSAALQPTANGGRMSDSNQLSGLSQTGQLHVLPIRAASPGSDASAISADDGYGSASDGYASATESLRSCSSFGSTAGSRAATRVFPSHAQAQRLSQTSDDGTSAVRPQDNGRDGSAAAVDPRSHSQTALSPRTNTQQSITGRVQALQDRVREVHTKLGTAAPQLPPMPAAGGPLMFRVEALEIALETLLAAEQANVEAVEAKSTSGCCSGCSIM